MINILVFSFVLSVVLTGCFRYYALRHNILDHPNLRSSHITPTPRGGGIGVVLSVFICSLLFYKLGLLPIKIILAIMGGGGLVALVGFIDDLRHVPAKVRVIFHFLSACFALFIVKELPPLPLSNSEIHFQWAGYILAAIYLVWLLNLYNFMDGIDGIASIETISVACGGSLILWLNNSELRDYLLLLLLAISTTGFLIWNWPPAKIFMGDVCSGFLGFSLGVYSLLSSSTASINLWCWLILLAVFMTDSTVTLILRILNGARFYEAHKSHTYQILSRRFNSHKKVTLGVLLINTIWLLPLAYLASKQPSQGIFYTFLAFLPLVVVALKSNAGVSNT